MITIFDLETTGIDPWNDRIVSIYVDTGEKQYSAKVNPGVEIPVAASVVHGITNERVKHSPSFRKIAEDIRPLFTNRVICGYNSRRFDTIMLHEEYKRAGLVPPYDLETVQEIDVLAVWRSVETHNLKSAVRRWLGTEHEDAHDAEEDARATWEVLKAIRKRYDLTTEQCVERSMSVSRSPSLTFKDGEWYFSFGMHRGKRCLDEPTYLQWMLSTGFDAETKRIVRLLLEAQSKS
jgi:DNA polymerase III subunit epsilon